MTDEASRKAILARRAKFIAAAVAGIGIACGKEPTASPPPLVCLEPMMQPDAEAARPTSSGEPEAGAAATSPMPCLSVVAPPPEDAGAHNQKRDAGEPHVCLRMVVKPGGNK